MGEARVGGRIGGNCVGTWWISRAMPADHRARLVWSFVESLDLSPLYDQVLRARAKRTAGRRSAVLLSLWLDATLEGVGSAREQPPPMTQPLAGSGTIGARIPHTGISMLFSKIRH